MRIALALAVVAVVGTPAHADRHRTRHLVAAGGALLLYEGLSAAQDDLAPARCRWCTPPPFDHAFRDALVWRDTDRAATLSDITAHLLAPGAALGFTLLAGDLDDTIPVAEAYAYEELVTEVIKLGAGRARPDGSDNLSFTSGHTAMAFAFAVSAGMVAHRRHARLEPAVWAVGLAIATATAYFRVAADRHWVSDVVGGAVVGSGIGVAVPCLSGAW